MIVVGEREEECRNVASPREMVIIDSVGKTEAHKKILVGEVWLPAYG